MKIRYVFALALAFFWLKYDICQLSADVSGRKTKTSGPSFECKLEKMVLDFSSADWDDTKVRNRYKA